MNIKTFFKAALFFIAFSVLVGCYKQTRDSTPVRLDAIRLESNRDGSLGVRNNKTNELIKFQPCGKEYKDPCPSEELDRKNLVGVQTINFYYFEKDINSVYCCIEFGSPGHKEKYCETFEELNRCPFGSPQ